MLLKFADLKLSPELQAGIDSAGFTDCTPIQSVTMPPVLEGKDVAGLAQTGTGKTAAFLLPLMERILRSREEVPSEDEDLKARPFTNWQRSNYILVLVPTRELAEQVYENALKLRGTAKLEAVAIYGGVAYEKQKSALRDGVQFIVATPGRLIDLYKEHVIDLRQVRAVVFDEADRMFDMGFKDDMKFILQRIPKDRQFLVFSATLNFDVLNTAYQFGAHPVECDVSRDQAKAENVVDKIFHVGNEEKARHLLSLLKKHSPTQAIIFSNFKNNVARITHFLNSNDVPSVGISSLLTQAQRNRVMEQFKGSSNRNILVATDVAARGLDIKGVDVVVNYELPDDPENYVHRIGRTGRAGASGLAFSFVSDRDVDALSRIEGYLGHKVDVDWLDDGDLIAEFKPFPSDRDLDKNSLMGSTREGGSGPAGSRGRDRGPRRDRGPGRPSDSRKPRTDSRPVVASSEGSAPQEASAEGAPQQHRDKTSGRHGRGDQRTRPGASGEAGAPPRTGPPSRPQPRSGERSQSRPQQGRGRDQQRSRDGRRPEGRSGQPSRPGYRPTGARTTPTQAPASLGQKVTGFFKKLFGSKNA